MLRYDGDPRDYDNPTFAGEIGLLYGIGRSIFDVRLRWFFLAMEGGLDGGRYIRQDLEESPYRRIGTISPEGFREGIGLNGDFSPADDWLDLRSR